MVVTIDGPAGAGKSTVSKALAKELGFAYLDTGSLYRALALAAQWDQADLGSEATVEAWLTRVELELRPKGGRFAVLLDGQDVEPFIRNESIAGLASELSAMAPVRAYLLGLQRRAATLADLVAEGRDMGSVVFPDAQVKFFLDADLGERARRRLNDLLPDNPALNLDEVLEMMAQRDGRDQKRKLSPLRPADDAFVIDSSDMSFTAVVADLAGRARSVLKSKN